MAMARSSMSKQLTGNRKKTLDCAKLEKGGSVDES